jgi:hypothetical protein
MSMAAGPPANQWRLTMLFKMIRGLAAAAALTLLLAAASGADAAQAASRGAPRITSVARPANPSWNYGRGWGYGRGWCYWHPYACYYR